MTQPAGPFDSARFGFSTGAPSGCIGIGGRISTVRSMLRRRAAPQQAVGASLAVVVVRSSTAVAAWLPPDALRVVFGGPFCAIGTRVARQAPRR